MRRKRDSEGLEVMSSILNGARPLPASRGHSGNLGRILRNTLLVASTLAAGGLAATAADAANITVITSGTITVGSETANLFGAGPSLVGDSYSLTVEYDGLGGNYFTTGIFGSDVGDPITGFVTATVNGSSVTTDITNVTSASLVEDLNDLFAANSGFDAAGDLTNVSQEINSANGFVPLADLQTDFQYALQPGDTGLDTYVFAAAGGIATAGFSGVPTSVEFLVPEPNSWAMLASGMLGLGFLVRRRRA
jgi:hypothetical protein